MNIGVSHKELNVNNATVLSSGAKLVAHELELLLNMPKYGLFFGNNMGVDLEKYLYLKNKQATFHLIRDDIVEALRKYGKANLKELTLVFGADSTLTIVLTVTVKSTQELVTLPIVLRE